MLIDPPEHEPGRAFDDMLRRLSEPELPVDPEARLQLERLSRVWSDLQECVVGYTGTLRFLMGWRWVDLNEARARFAAVQSAIREAEEAGLPLGDMREALADAEARLRWTWPWFGGRVLVCVVAVSGRLTKAGEPLLDLQLRTMGAAERRRLLDEMERLFARAGRDRAPQEWDEFTAALPLFLMVFVGLGALGWLEQHIPAGAWRPIAIAAGMLGFIALAVVAVVTAAGMGTRWRGGLATALLEGWGVSGRWLKRQEREWLCLAEARVLRVEQVDPGSDAGCVGAQPGDDVVAYRDVPLGLLSRARIAHDAPFTITVVRHGARLDLPLRPPVEGEGA